MENKIQNGANFLNTLNIIYYGLLAGCLSFFFFAYLQFQDVKNIPIQNSDLDIFAYIVPFLCISQTAIGYFIFGKQIQKAFEMTELSEKLAHFQSSFLIKMALFEGAALFSVVSYYLTASNAFALWFGVMLMVMTFNRPTPQNIAKTLQLNQKEIDWLEAR